MSAKYLFVYFIPGPYGGDHLPSRCSTGGTKHCAERNRAAPMDVTERILAEYRDFPGLRLTTRQAARLWALEFTECERLLNQLVVDGDLFVDATCRYGWRGSGHETCTRAAEPRASEAVV